VLSTTNGTLCACAIFAYFSTSTTSEFGFPSVSMNNAFVFSWNAASTSSSLKMSTNVVVIPYCGSVCSNKLKDPP